jgi:hypothetical protein
MKIHEIMFTFLSDELAITLHPSSIHRRRFIESSLRIEANLGEDWVNPARGLRQSLPSIGGIIGIDSMN